MSLDTAFEEDPERAHGAERPAAPLVDMPRPQERPGRYAVMFNGIDDAPPPQSPQEGVLPPAEPTGGQESGTAEGAEPAPSDPETAEVPAEENKERVTIPGHDLAQFAYRARTLAPQDRTKEVAESSTPVEKVVGALNAGKSLAVSVEWDGSGAPPKISMSKDIVPANVVTKQDLVSMAERQPSDDSSGSQELVERPRDDLVWARLVPTHQSAKKTEVVSDAPLGMKLAELEVTDDARALVVRAEKVPSKELEIAKLRTEIQLRNASNGNSKQDLTPLEERRSRLAQAEETAPAAIDVLVAAKDEASLRRFARQASTVLPTEANMLWKLETVDGKLKTHGTAEEAAAAPRTPGKFDHIASAEDFAKLAQLPRDAVRGLPDQVHEEYAQEQTIPDDEPSVVIADMTHMGKVIDQLRLPIRALPRHVLLEGGTGAAKTTVAQEAIVQISKLFEQLPIIVADLGKVGAYAPELRERFAGEGINKPVDHITLGGDDIPINLNMMRPNEIITPANLVRKVALLLSKDIPGDDAKRAFRKYVQKALVDAYESDGWDTVTGKSRYPHGEPPVPDMKSVLVSINRVINSTDFQQKTKDDLKGFTVDQMKGWLLGSAGRMFQAGYEIDWKKVMARGGVTSIDLGDMDDPELRGLALSAIFNGLTAELRATKGEAGAVDNLRAIMMMDETNGALDDDVLGSLNAGQFPVVRDLKLSLWVMQQDKLNTLHPHVRSNTLTTIAMNTPDGPDQAVVASKIAFRRPEQARHLAYMGVGEGVMFNSTYTRNGPVAFRTQDPRKAPRGKGVPGDLTQIVRQGNDLEFYKGDTKARAERLLDEPLGDRLVEWGRLNVYQAAMRRNMLPLSEEGKLRRDIDAKMQEDPKAVEAAISSAVGRLTAARPELMYATTNENITRAVVEHMTAQVRRTPQEVEDIPRDDISVNIGYYSPVKDKIAASQLATPLEGPTYDRYASVLGPVEGKTADRQMAQLEHRRQDSLAAVHTAITTPHLSDEAKHAAMVELAKLMGGSSHDDGLGRVSQDLVQRYKRGLTDAQTQSLNALSQPLEHQTLQSNITAVQDDLQNDTNTQQNARQVAEARLARLQQLEATLAFGYEAMRRDLLTHKQQYATEHAGPVDLEDEEIVYEKNFMRRPDGTPFQTAAEQWKHVTELEDKHLKETGYTINENNLRIARDRAKGGLDADRLLVPETESYASQEQDAANNVTSEQYTLVGVIKNGDLFAKEWRTKFEAQLYGDGESPPDFEVSPIDGEMLTAAHQSTINTLSVKQQWLNAQAAKLAQQQTVQKPEEE